MKKSEMKVGVTYIICPDKNKKCRLFWNNNGWSFCDGNCSYLSKLKFVIICRCCGEMIVLDGDHDPWRKIDHKCSSKSGTDCCSQHRSDENYYLLYKIPTEGGG